MIKRSLGLLALLLVVLSGCQGKPSIDGNWEGTLKIANPQAPGVEVELKVVVHLTKQSEGTYTATMDSPNQGAKDIPIDTVTVKDGSVDLDVKKIAGNFHGKQSDDGNTITGEWKQAAVNLPLTLKRVKEGN